MLRRLLTMVVALSGATTAFGQSSLFKIDLSTRSTGAPTALSDAQYTLYQQNLWNLTYLNRTKRKALGLIKPNAPIIAPAMIRFKKNGSVMKTGGLTRGTGISLVIDPTFNQSGDLNRVQFMTEVYTAAVSYIEQFFGDAAIAGTVNVINADASIGIGDRQAIAGGYYLPNNGSGGREIRMPYNPSREVAAISLIHCILLAYLPDPAYAFDGYLEGLVRAATTNIVRIPAATQTATGGLLDQEVIENVLEQTYDIGAFYDWTNQKSLGGPQFIAPNLLSAPVFQGTRGGMFLQRYQMAGTVWEKMLTQYPNFIKDMNLAYRSYVSSNPGTPATAAQLEAMGAGVLGSSTVEGDTFTTWVRKQHILDTRLTVGTKLHSLITPITSGLNGTAGDFGVFLIEGTLVSTDAAGNETLLSGTSYPAYWTTTYDRIFTDSQSERMDIAASYGSVVPNFTDGSGVGTPYRVALDLPVQDRLVRQYLPAGAIATPALGTTVNDFYGTIVGLSVPLGNSLIVRVHNGSENFDVPVSNYAFGSAVGTANFLGARSLLIEVLRRDSFGAETLMLTRRVNKGPGPLGIQLGNDPVTTTSFPSGLAGGVQLVGFTGDPLYSGLENIFGTSNFLAARYNPARTTYDLYPNSGAVAGGQGYFVRVPSTGSPSWLARVEQGTAVAVALRPGWNMITCPLGVDTDPSNVIVAHMNNIPRTYANASGNDGSGATDVLLGRDFFQFVPGAPDATTGLPEGGSYSPGTSFVAGKGYFVRCLAAEGAVMLFKPAVGQSFIKQAAAVPVNLQHLLEVRVSRTGESSFTRIGQASGATNGFDARFDSNLPPSFGGLQIAVPNGDLRFQDVKAPSTMITTRTTVSGLIAGKKYTLNFLTKIGRATQIQIKDIQTGTMQFYGTPTGTFGFTASKSTMSFDVTVRGARS